jgi:hypothetical protein
LTTKISFFNSTNYRSSVQCATGYKIYQRIGDVDSADNTLVSTTQDLNEAFENLEPCVDYFYAVSTLVAEQVGTLSNQGTLNEREGSVQLTSLAICKK